MKIVAAEPMQGEPVQGLRSLDDGFIPPIIDLSLLEGKRDRMVAELGAAGYQVCRPEGTFYMWVRSPDPDDLAFTERLAGLGALVLPGTIVESPGWFRISLTASDEMVERGLEVFRTAAEAVPVP